MIDRLDHKVRSRAPLRLGLAGGGTDLSPFCDLYGGAVLNATIDRYAFASILPSADNQVIFSADDIGTQYGYALGEPVDDCPLELHRAVYKRMIHDFNKGVPIPLTIRTSVDAPAGSGLGSSSALVVALVDAFREVLDAPLGVYDVARLAFEIERVDLGLAGGRQDQYAATFGGVNFIEFLDGERVVVNPMRVPLAIKNEFESSLVTCFTGRSRRSADIIARQTEGLSTGNEKTLQAMEQLKADASEMKRALLVGDIRRMAEILNKSWIAKKASASGITTDQIDDYFDVAFRSGAIGGKVSGAGGGGFMFFIVDPEHRHHLIQNLNAAGGDASPVKFTSEGCETWRFV